MRRNRTTQSFVSLTLTSCLVLPSVGCSSVERRVATVDPDFDEVVVHASVEQREVKKTITWKPILTALILGAAVGAAGMIVYGFYYPEYRPVAITGIVIGAVLPFAAIPIAATPNVPWMREEGKPWAPAPGIGTDVELVGRDDERFAKTSVETDSQGRIDLPMNPFFCQNARWGDLGEIQLVLHIPDGDSRGIALPVDRLAGKVPCVPAGASLLSTRTEVTDEP